MADFDIKKGDTRPVFLANVTDNGVNVDITEATKCYLIIREVGAEGKVEAPYLKKELEMVNKATGEVRYKWTKEDTDTVGNYYCEIEVQWSDGGVETFPKKGFKTLDINQDLD